jgi:hypothetical protein
VPENVARAAAGPDGKVARANRVRHPDVVAEEVEEQVERAAHLADLVAACVVGELHRQIALGRRGGDLRRIGERSDQVARDDVSGEGAADGHHRDQQQGAPHRELHGAADLGDSRRFQRVGRGLDAVDQLDLAGAEGQVLLQVLAPRLGVRALGREIHDPLFEPVEDVRVHPLGGDHVLGQLGGSQGLHLRDVAGVLPVCLELARVLARVEGIQHVAAHPVAHHHHVEAQLQRLELEDVVDPHDLLYPTDVLDREAHQRSTEQRAGEEQAEERHAELLPDVHRIARRRKAGTAPQPSLDCARVGAGGSP